MPPYTGDGLLFVLSGAQREHAQKQHIVGTNMQRLAIVKSAFKGQPVFLFDADARTLHGPYSAEGPGDTNIDRSNPRLPAQLRFTNVVRSFLPLPETAISDLLDFEPGHGDGKGRRPTSHVESTTVGQLLWLYVLRHHGLFDEDDDEAEAPEEPPPPPPRPAAPRPGGSRGAGYRSERGVGGRSRGRGGGGS